jgi:hypothetical protein
MTYGDTDTNRLSADYVRKIIAGTNAGALVFRSPVSFGAVH